MTTIEGQLAVLGGAATRPQGDTEVNILWHDNRRLDYRSFKMIYMYVRIESRNNKTDDLQQTDRQTEDQSSQGDENNHSRKKGDQEGRLSNKENA